MGTLGCRRRHGQPDRDGLCQVIGCHVGRRVRRPPAGTGRLRQRRAVGKPRDRRRDVQGRRLEGHRQDDVNQWVGAAANAAVAQCLLQKMGYKVETSTLAEEVAWQGFETGEVDVILENWGHPDLEKKYIADTKKATDAGPNGVTGIIGWYVPGWMVDKYPDIDRLAQPQQVRRPVQDLRVRRQGPVPRQRPDVRPVRRGADHQPRPELQGRLLGQRGRHDHRVPAGRQEQDAAHRLLLRPAVAPERDQARQDRPAGLDRRAAMPT